jgi:hypothetical protein
LLVAVAVAANTMKALEGVVVLAVAVVSELLQKPKCQLRLTQLPLVLVGLVETSRVVQMEETQFLIQ